MSSDRLNGDTSSDTRVARQRPLYSESQVIMTTVKAVIPFVLTYGLFITFHGTSSPGGGFQGGALIASVVLMIAFAFGIESTRTWLSNTLVVLLATLGVAIFAGIALVPMALGENFLDYTAYYPVLGDVLGLKEYEFVKYGMEAVEIGGIAFIVSGVLMGLFFALAAGMTPPSSTDTDADTAADTGADTASESSGDVASGDAETPGDDGDTAAAGNDEQAGETQ
ncbi:cation:proton antiporter [Halonotius aquaticus]|uniref:Cation:proton antiporter n=1 Tax=Halonotius aquaticus TaxID=2216978 RepID=A0A3A6QDK6_9EURY|nr:MnhB domain-containing protein [Halonotius aquaticus]RJX44861.1 cation:proton antiporter [Halonotius aquaticus]